MTWSEADAYCVSIGARLAKLDTDAKINIVDSGEKTIYKCLIFFGKFFCLTEGLAKGLL